MSIRVSIVEDDERYRAFLVQLINDSEGLTCSGDHGDATSALRRFPRERPEVALVDLELPTMTGMELIRRARRLKQAPEMVVLTVHDDPRRIFGALEAGASGYLIKPVEPIRVVEAITEAHGGGAPMSPAIARLVLQYFHEKGKAREALDTLTPREQEILDALAHGLRYQEIADQLGISRRTVSTHIHNLYEKLHVRSRTEATARLLGQSPTAGEARIRTTA